MRYDVLEPCPEFLNQAALFEAMGFITLARRSDEIRVWVLFTAIKRVSGYSRTHHIADKRVSEKRAIEILHETFLGGKQWTIT